MNERNIAGYLSGEWTIDKKLQNMLDKKRISEKESKDTLRKVCLRVFFIIKLHSFV